MYVQFPSTRISLFAIARDPREDVRRKAVNELVEIYTSPLRTFLILNRGFTEEKAKEILQDFVLDKFLERNVFARFERKEGVKFRSFLIKVLIYYVINHETLITRSDKELLVDDSQLANIETADPSKNYDICWARRVVREALVLMEAECFASDRWDLWAVFAERLAGPILEGTPPTPYEELAARFGLPTTKQVHDLLSTAKRKYQRALRSVVGQYSCGKAAIEEEIRELMRTLAQANGRVDDPDAASNAGEDKS